MKDFIHLPADHVRCLGDLLAFRDLLAGKPDLEENADIKPFFEAHLQLATFIGTGYSTEIASCDLYAFQYQLFGDFGCDLVVGDSRRRNYCFVELEDGSAGCLFRQQGRKATPEWSGRLERGFSQIVDWFWKLDDMSRTDEFAARFGTRHARYEGLLVMGRDSELQHPREENRWHWRSRKVSINSRPLRLVTYDQLYRDLSALYQHFFPGASV